MRSHRFSLLPGAYAVVRLGPCDPLPQGAAEAEEDLFSLTRTADELSLVCSEARVPNDSHAERGWRALKLDGPFSFDEVGVLASFASPLADRGISIFVLSTFDTDYLLVRQHQVDEALDALQRSGHLQVR